MKNKSALLKAAVCVVLAFAIPFALAGCKDKADKQTEKIAGRLISERHFEEKYKDPDGKVAFRSDVILPQLDEKDEPQYSAFNKIMDAVISESESSAKTVIANKLYEKGKPWKETGSYTVPYASEKYISVVVERQREAASGNVSYYYTPVTFSLSNCTQSSLSAFSKVSSDYLQTQLAKALMAKISQSGASVPEFSVIRSSFDLTDFVFTSGGFDIYFTKNSLSGFSGVQTHYGFTFDEVADLLNLPNIPE